MSRPPMPMVDDLRQIVNGCEQQIIENHEKNEEAYIQKWK